MNPYTLSVVIPVYNSEDILEDLLEELFSELPNFAKQYEVILVNDGSPDGSWDKITELGKKHEQLLGINLQRNFGQHNAMLAGILASKNDVILTMDDDMQHPPQAIGLLLEKLQEGADVVYGSPIKQTHNFFRDSCSALVKYAFEITIGVDIARDMSAFRAFHTHLKKAFVECHNLCLLYTSPSPRDATLSRMPSSA